MTTLFAELSRDLDQFVDRSLSSTSLDEIGNDSSLRGKGSIPDERASWFAHVEYTSANNSDMICSRITNITERELTSMVLIRNLSRYLLEFFSLLSSLLFSSPIARPMTSAYPAAHRGFYFYILHVQMTRERRIVSFPLSFLCPLYSPTAKRRVSYHKQKKK